MDNTPEPDNVIPSAPTTGLSSPVPYPQHKPSNPSTPNGMRDAMSTAEGVVRDVRTPLQLHSSDLVVDHPYGDGQHGESGSATLARLGAEKKYGE